MGGGGGVVPFRGRGDLGEAAACSQAGDFRRKDASPEGT